MAKNILVRIDEKKCDGCGKCVVACHEGVIRIINGKAKVVNESSCDGLGSCLGECPLGAITVMEEDLKTDLPCGCPGVKIMDMRGSSKSPHPSGEDSQLQNWPIQLQLVSPGAPFLKNADLLIAADCVGFSCPDFHNSLLAGKVLINFCPKLNPALEAYRDKLTAIFERNEVKSVTIAHMEVACCFGLVKVVREALAASKKEIILKEIIVAIRGGQK